MVTENDAAPVTENDTATVTGARGRHVEEEVVVMASSTTNSIGSGQKKKQVFIGSTGAIEVHVRT